MDFLDSLGWILPESVSCSCSQMVTGAEIIWSLYWAGYPRWCHHSHARSLSQKDWSSWGPDRHLFSSWLASASSHYDSVRVTGLLIRQLSSPRANILSNPGISCRAYYLAWDVIQYHFCHNLLVKDDSSQGWPELRGMNLYKDTDKYDS